MDSLQVEPQLLQRYDRPGPRYTSYPTAVEFHERFGAAEYAACLRSLKLDQGLSLYLHLPFCEHRCTFCGCHVVITPKREVAGRYLEYLEREMDLVCGHLASRPKVIQYHWGGGTPTYYAPDQIRHLHALVQARFAIEPGAEVAIEVDPRVTTREHIDALLEVGFNRLSMGVQDFTPEVQEAIDRNQEEASTRELYSYCRQLGFNSINLDLIYGLPKQTPEGFARNLEIVLELRPDRVALYSYAHVPWIRGHQKYIEVEALPPREIKFALFLQARRAFLEAGYQQIGMDHFALPTDELSQALGQRRLRRNFMGYTVQRSPQMMGLGISAIGQLSGAYVQNQKKLSTYYESIEAGRLPVERGYALSEDDQVRQHVIAELMCNLYLNFAEVEARFGINFGEYFASELVELEAGPAADGFARIGEGCIEVTGLGQLFVRNTCMLFDRHLREKPPARPQFSRTV
ncbi:MAG: oxygen-independent coproporphyrinogen III oxidase [Candidatus Handelsmanbacteria bacterium]|nr:oxygen-independent coproporphyrinogen III oxidase [Candidatus Handelsmanbacteria bacterium]